MRAIIAAPLSHNLAPMSHDEVPDDVREEEYERERNSPEFKEEKHQEQEDEARERVAPSGVVVYKTILKEGQDELDRSSSALFWSGLAAGLSMSFSMIGEGLLKAYLPDAQWAKLIYGFGYSLGFLFVILGRQQLFTENTLTPILPLLQRKTWKRLKNVARLWGIVLGANLLGGLLVSLVIAHTHAFEPQVKAAFYELARTALEPSWDVIMLRGVFAGWMIALMVWLLPFAQSARVGVIIIVTYFVAIGHFSHIIAGSIEVFTYAAAGRAGWLDVAGHYVLPTLIGNIAGGLTLVAALNHAQIVAGADENPL